MALSEEAAVPAAALRNGSGLTAGRGRGKVVGEGLVSLVNSRTIPAAPPPVLHRTSGPMVSSAKSTRGTRCGKLVQANLTRSSVRWWKGESWESSSNASCDVVSSSEDGANAGTAVDDEMRADCVRWAEFGSSSAALDLREGSTAFDEAVKRESDWWVAEEYAVRGGYQPN